MGMKAKSLSHSRVSETHSIMHKETRVTLLPSDPEMLRIEMRIERKLLPALQTLQVPRSLFKHFFFSQGVSSTRAGPDMALLEVVFSCLFPSKSG